MRASELVTGLAHIGIRVGDLARSRAFYESLGFTLAWGPVGPEPVAAMTHPSGVEINLIVNAPRTAGPNILMDVPEKHPGITHFALAISDVATAEATLTAAGIEITGRRGRISTDALFIRDPDGTVIELAAD